MLEENQNGKSAFEATLRRNENVAMYDFAPRSNWSAMGDSDHFVQFYETEAFLLNSLSEFIGTGLSAGESGVVVATRGQREGLEKRLHSLGLDVAAASACGQFISLDADETLSKFMIDGQPEPNRFADVIGSVITKASQSGKRVRIFGEMVSLLGRAGNHAAAIRLEELWNTLRKSHSFSLFCAYPMTDFQGDALAGVLGDVCATHTCVIPAESYNTLDNREERLRAIIRLQQKARSLEAEIAERERTEEALRAAKNELEELLVREHIARAEAETANRMKDEFLATVSHELRTPLNAIIGWAHLLRHDRLDEATVARGIETIERNAKSQAQLIEDILDVSRVITGNLRLNIGLVDAAAIINAAIDSVQLAADAKEIQLEVTLDPSARHISGDANRLQQVVWNLLANAIKFTPPGGHVRVLLERADSDVQIKVSDTGQGIRSDFLPFVFDRFRQADSSSTRGHGGLGLGLAIVRHLVEIHGGTVQADSPGEGLGASFTIRLPLVPAQEREKSRKRETGRLELVENSTVRLNTLPSLDGVRVAG